MRVALIHDWLTGMRGGEKVLECLVELFPKADIYTLLWNKGTLSKTIEACNITESFIARIPFAKKIFRAFLPLFPSAIEQFDLKHYDLVLSSSHCVAKGAIPAAHAKHIAYIHTPMRYVWDQYTHYITPNLPLPVRLAAPLIANYLRTWDVASAHRVDAYIANSSHVASRIQAYWRREAAVIHPPVDIPSFQLGNSQDYYLCVGALVPYKRFDLAIEACKELKRKLIIVGTGSQEKQLRKCAGAQTHFVGWLQLEELVKLYSRCRALLFPAEEDFGISIVEAMASGKPVIAFRHGGQRDLIKPGLGLFFEEQTVPSLTETIKQFESLEKSFDPSYIRNESLRFDRAIFKEKMVHFLKSMVTF